MRFCRIVYRKKPSSELYYCTSSTSTCTVEKTSLKPDLLRYKTPISRTKTFSMQMQSGPRSTDNRGTDKILMSSSLSQFPIISELCFIRPGPFIAGNTCNMHCSHCSTSESQPSVVSQTPSSSSTSPSSPISSLGRAGVGHQVRKSCGFKKNAKMNASSKAMNRFSPWRDYKYPRCPSPSNSSHPTLAENTTTASLITRSSVITIIFNRTSAQCLPRSNRSL